MEQDRYSGRAMESTPLRVTDDAPPDPAPAAARRPRSDRRWAVLGIVVFLILSGLGSLSYLGWKYVGTDLVAGRGHVELTQEIRERWQHPTVGDVVGPSASPALGSADALVRIPRFGPDFEMPLVEGVRDEDLAKGIGHFPGAGPGQLGNFALSAYRVTYGEPFKEMAQLRPGDRVIVEKSDAIYTYVLDTNPNDVVVPFTETWVISPVPVPPGGEAPAGMPTFDSKTPTQAVITLTTSSEPLHADNRMVAFGHLVETTPK